MTTSAGTSGQYHPYYNSSSMEWKDMFIECGGKRFQQLNNGRKDTESCWWAGQAGLRLLGLEGNPDMNMSKV